MELGVYANYGNEFKDKVVFGFPNQCCGLTADEVTLTKIENTSKMDKFKIMTGLTRTGDFRVYNFEEIALWTKKERSGFCPVFLSSIPFSLHWQRQINLNFFSGFEQCIQILNHLRNCQN